MPTMSRFMMNWLVFFFTWSLSAMQDTIFIPLHLNLFVGMPGSYLRFAAGRRMGLASQETVFLFNYRAHRERDVLDKLVFISGRRGDGSQTKDGVRALHSILKDAIENHGKTCLKVPRKAIIKLKSKAIKSRYL